MMIRTDSTLFACSGAEATPDPVVIPMPFGARLLVAHEISGDGVAGGHVSLEIGDTAEGVFVPHHGDGYNIPADDEAQSYACVFDNCGPFARLTVNITDRTHTVWYQVLE